MMSQRPQLDWQRYNQRPIVWFWFALCILLPINLFSVYRDTWFWLPPKPVGDGPDYENIAFHLYAGDGFVIDTTDPDWQQAYSAKNDAYIVHLSDKRRLIATGRPPLLPLVVSGIYRLLGRNDAAFAAVRMLLASCLALSGATAVYVAGQLLSKSTSPSVPLVGCAASLLFSATNRTLRGYATDFLTEPMALLLMQVFVVQVIALGKIFPEAIQARRTLQQATWAGVTFGALILTRSMFVVWLPAIGLLVMLALPMKPALRLKAAVLLVAAACVVCLPWWVRNVLVLERMMPLGTQGAITLLGGYSDIALESNGDWQAEPEQRLRKELAVSSEFQAIASDTQREVVVAQQASKRVRTWIRQHLDDLPLLAARRIYVHWNPYSGRSLLWKLAILTGVFGLIAQRDRAAWWLVGLPLVSTLVVAAFYSTGGRFLVPLYGVLFTLAGFGSASIFFACQWLRRTYGAAR